MLNIAIIGGGAAGFFAAITAKTQNPECQVTIYERAGKVLAKVAVTGGGRCNLTNSFASIADLKQAYPRGFRLIKRLFNTFDYRDTYQWFERNGVPLVTQEDQCVFPVSQDAMSVVRCLTEQARKLGVKVLTGHKVSSIEVSTQEMFTLRFVDAPSVQADRVAVTTGGMPHIENALNLQGLHHHIESPMASLFTFNIKNKALQSLMGTVVIPASIAIPSTKFKAQGPILITHWGLSGPAVLKLSSYAARYLHEHGYRVPVSVNWVNEPNRSVVEEGFITLAQRNPQKQLLNVRPWHLPTRLWQYLLDRVGLPAERKWAETGQKNMNKLIEILTNDTYMIDGKGAFKEEFVTCGGVSLSDINYNTLESKQTPGLFFAGEVLDIDAITGGFNLQAAWTTGYVMGLHISNP